MTHTYTVTHQIPHTHTQTSVPENVTSSKPSLAACSLNSSSIERVMRPGSDLEPIIVWVLPVL
jgi:hypothetical protein